VDVADISVMIIVGHAEARLSARDINVATRCGEDTTQLHSLSTCHPDGAPVLLEEDSSDCDKTPVCEADNQGPQNSLLPVCWIERRSSTRARRGGGPR
jgi:hypothetical protein